jgi:hypothetical protein
MADYREGVLLYLPGHMHEAVTWWFEKGEPHPSVMGSFLRAVLENKLVDAYDRADHINTPYMRNWASFLNNCAPIGSWGSPEILERWWGLHHPPKPEETAETITAPNRADAEDDIP